jgi:hypothetical protein
MYKWPFVDDLKFEHIAGSFLKLPDIDAPFAQAPTEFQDEFQQAICSPSDPLSYLIAGAFPEHVFLASQYMIKGSKIFSGYSSQNCFDKLRRVSELPDVPDFHVHGFATFKCSGDIRRFGRNPSHYVLLSNPLAPETIFHISGLRNFFFGFIPNSFASVLGLNRIHRYKIPAAASHTMIINLERLELEVDKKVFGIPNTNWGYRAVIICDRRPTGIQIEGTGLIDNPRPNLCPLSEPLKTDEFLSFFSLTQIEAACPSGRSLLQDICREELTKCLITRRFLMQFELSNINLAILYKIIAIRDEPFDIDALRNMNYPFSLKLSTDPVISKFWAIPRFREDLRELVNRTYERPDFHLLKDHRSALIIRRKDVIWDESVDFFLVLPAQFCDDNSVRINCQDMQLPQLLENKIEIIPDDRVFLFLPISLSSRDWIIESPFELMILMKHMFLESDDDIAFVKSIFLESISICSPFFLAFGESFSGLFLHDDRFAEYPKDYDALVGKASHFRAISLFLSKETENFI